MFEIDIKNDNDDELVQNLSKFKKKFLIKQNFLAKSKNLKNYQNLSKSQKTIFKKANILANLPNIKATKYLKFQY